MNLQPQLKIKSDDISPYVLLPGDPQRVELIGKYLKNFRIIADSREFKIGLGKYKDILVTVCSTGIGCPSTAIAAEELINAGAKYLIRVGTCGGAWRSDILAGSLIIPTASIRDEGTTKEYIGPEFPAAADFYVTEALINAAKSFGANYFVGINRTHDAFYGSQSSITKWGSYFSGQRWQREETPILSSEMESSALFIIASLRGVKAGAILAVNGYPEPLKNRLINKNQIVAAEADPLITKETVEKAIKVSLEAIVNLNKNL